MVLFLFAPKNGQPTRKIAVPCQVIPKDMKHIGLISRIKDEDNYRLIGLFL